MNRRYLKNIKFVILECFNRGSSVFKDTGFPTKTFGNDIDEITSNNIFIKDGRFILWLLAIVVFFIVLQSIFFGHRWVDDESWYTMPVPSILQEGSFRIPTIPGDDKFWPQPPLLTYMEALVDATIGLSPMAARVVPLSAGILLIIVTYAWAARMFNRSVGLWAAFFVMADNLVFLASRIARPEILVTLFTVAALLFLEIHRQKQHAKRWIILSALMCGLAIASHPNGVLTPCLVGLAIIMGQEKWQTKLITCLWFGFWTVVSIVPLAVWIIQHDAPYHFENFKAHWLGRHGRYASDHHSSVGFLGSLLSNEIHQRYKDFIQFPFRVHIAAGSLAVLAVSLWRSDHKLRFLSISVFAWLLFFIVVNNSNPSVRYMTVIVPFIAVLWAYWTSNVLRNIKSPTSWMMIVVLIGGMGLSQILGNAFYLWKFRRADYAQVIQEIKKIIPPDSTVYGSMSFWMGLRDYRFVPYIRTKWPEAVERYHPDVVIMDDWVMMGGGPGDEWTRLRETINEDLESKGTLIGEIHNPFYGNLKIYSVDHSL